MARTSIQQFHAALADGANQTPLMRAYRVIARHTAPDRASVGLDWPQWPAAVAAAGEWIPWGAESRAAGDWIPWGSAPAAHARAEGPARFAAWGDWATPPGAAA